MAPMSQPASNSFPILKAIEVLESTREMGLQLNQDDLSHPTPPRVQLIYEWWLNHFFRFTFDDIKKAAEDQLDQMEYPEIHRDIVTLGVFHRVMYQLMVTAGVDDFSLSDLSAPTTVRVVMILSALINFYLFEQEMAAKYLHPVREEDAEHEAREEALASRNTEMATKIDEERERRRANEPQTQEIKARTKEVVAEIKGIRTQYEAIERSFKALSNEMKQISAEISDITQTNIVQEQEILRLKAQTIQSPDRLRSTISEMQRSLEQEKDSVASLEQKERLLQGKISSLQKYELELSSCIKVLDEWEIDVAKLKEITGQHQDYVEQYETLIAEEAELNDKLNLLKRRVNNALDESARYKEKTDRKLVLNEQRKKSLNEQLAQLSDQKRAMEMAATAKNREAQEVENQIREIYNSLHTELDAGTAKYRQIYDQFGIYSAKLNLALKSINNKVVST